jgi:hypothetical protein
VENNKVITPSETASAGDEFDAFARALAESLRTRYRGRDQALDFARQITPRLGGLLVHELVVNERDFFGTKEVRIIIVGEVSP